MELKIDHIDDVEEFHTAIESFVRGVAAALAMEYDKKCLEAFRNLSKHKKNKIKKWIHKEIKRMMTIRKGGSIK